MESEWIIVETDQAPPSGLLPPVLSYYGKFAKCVGSGTLVSVTFLHFAQLMWSCSPLTDRNDYSG